MMRLEEGDQQIRPDIGRIERCGLFYMRSTSLNRCDYPESPVAAMTWDLPFLGTIEL